MINGRPISSCATTALSNDICEGIPFDMASYSGRYHDTQRKNFFPPIWFRDAAKIANFNHTHPARSSSHSKRLPRLRVNSETTRQTERHSQLDDKLFIDTRLRRSRGKKYKIQRAERDSVDGKATEVLDARSRPFLFKHRIFLLKHQMTFIKLEHLDLLDQLLRGATR
jgi:hypothetical protein